MEAKLLSRRANCVSCSGQAVVAIVEHAATPIRKFGPIHLAARNHFRASASKALVVPLDYRASQNEAGEEPLTR